MSRYELWKAVPTCQHWLVSCGVRHHPIAGGLRIVDTGPDDKAGTGICDRFAPATGLAPAMMTRQLRHDKVHLDGVTVRSLTTSLVSPK